MSGERDQPIGALDGAEALVRALSSGPAELRLLLESSWQGLGAVTVVFGKLAHKALGPAPTPADFSAYAREVARLSDQHDSPLNALVVEALLRCAYGDDRVARNIPGEAAIVSTCNAVYSIVTHEGVDTRGLAVEAWDATQELAGDELKECARLWLVHETHARGLQTG
jgi:hypothetical protein